MDHRLTWFRGIAVAVALLLGSGLFSVVASSPPAGADVRAVTVKGYVVNFGRKQVGRLVFLGSNDGPEADAKLGAAQSGTEFGPPSHFRSYSVVLHINGSRGVKVRLVAFLEPVDPGSGQFAGSVGVPRGLNATRENICGNGRTPQCPQSPSPP